ncbi:MAG: hypothetical protein VR69_04775 [Peptococcaceae bacterium BRH_c4b]|nr:MAG: hypothetical protein VR69_04775 [Peptococcaceae bacterium BRH_c4b]
MHNFGAARRKKRYSALLWTGLLMLVLLAAGCGGRDDAKKPADADKPPIVAAEKPVMVTLYFADSQAEKLLPEEREVLVENGKSLGEVVVSELIKGPRQEGLTKTIPESAKLLSLNVVDGVANVNFSKEIQTKHWGGSAGETMTVYSITNSLAKLDGIKKVQFLVEGKKVESLLGHMDTSEPVEPGMDLVESK